MLTPFFRPAWIVFFFSSLASVLATIAAMLSITPSAPTEEVSQAQYQDIQLVAWNQVAQANPKEINPLKVEIRLVSGQIGESTGGSHLAQDLQDQSEYELDQMAPLPSYLLTPKAKLERDRIRVEAEERVERLNKSRTSPHQQKHVYEKPPKASEDYRPEGKYAELYYHARDAGEKSDAFRDAYRRWVKEQEANGLDVHTPEGRAIMSAKHQELRKKYYPSESTSDLFPDVFGEDSTDEEKDKNTSTTSSFLASLALMLSGLSARRLYIEKLPPQKPTSGGSSRPDVLGGLVSMAESFNRGSR